MSKSALQELYDQKNILKKSKTTMLNIANTLGVSQTVIRYIDTRTTQDKWILFAGIMITVFLMWLIVHYFGK
jgi:Golgi SNAP receptor complex protein 2